jgi:hypothetical protein
MLRLLVACAELSRMRDFRDTQYCREGLPAAHTELRIRRRAVSAKSYLVSSERRQWLGLGRTTPDAALCDRYSNNNGKYRRYCWDLHREVHQGVGGH